MSLGELIVYLVLAGICGTAARAVAGKRGGSFIVSVLLGFLGAILGTSIARLMRLPELVLIDIEGHPFPVLWSIVGGMVLVVIAHALTRPRYVDRHAP
jgi:uncharacterized membrane protein YeaQ/YmgE (transglycosylase-associated protein family)